MGLGWGMAWHWLRHGSGMIAWLGLCWGLDRACLGRLGRGRGVAGPWLGHGWGMARARLGVSVAGAGIVAGGECRGRG